ncbi:LysR family transcriptional regulator [Paenibacillus tarimensis]|uniref:LysR family transcriptional regulator n=1 Tax=Paenibacillus tarimensis TaxID=416012 RepID=UPI001F3DEFF6|nr:LysR family transcriptional regulator [Paenibacillus tarimensis]MCF2944572.1 LysR family transcriptional regulator [Paenibacillus tarimensis]
MNTKKLEVVVGIARYKKVTLVAEHLGIKQPSVTFHMKSLEEEMGVPLFEHRAGKVLLTEAGNALLHYASKILALSQEAKRVLGEYQTFDRGTLTIGASYVPGTYLLPEAIDRLAQMYPGITVRLKLNPAPTVLAMLEEHSIDVGLISYPAFENPSLHINPVRSDDLVLAFPNTHSFSGRGTITPRDIAGEPFILHDSQSTTRRITEEWAEHHGMKLRVNMEADSLETIKRAVRAGMGVSFISQMAIEEEADRGLLKYRPIPELSTKRFIFACCQRDRWLTSPIRTLLELLGGTGATPG